MPAIWRANTRPCVCRTEANIQQRFETGKYFFVTLRCNLKHKAMAKYTITINDRTNKTKYLLGLIKEMAKTEKYIEITDQPNKETEKAMTDSINGNVTRTRGKRDFFNKLNA